MGTGVSAEKSTLSCVFSAAYFEIRLRAKLGEKCNYVNYIPKL